MEQLPDPRFLPANAALSQTAPIGPPRSAMERFFLDESRRLRTAWRFLIFILGFIAAQIGAGIVVIVIAVAFFAVRDGQITEERLEELAKGDSVWLMALSTIPMTAASALAVVVCRLFLDRRSLTSMGLVRPARRWNSSWVVGFLLGALPIAVGFAAVYAAGGFRLGEIAFSWEAAVLAPMLVIAAFHEELVFRGYLLQNMLDIKRPVAGVIISSLLFWLVHSFNPAAWSSPWVGVNLFGAGVLLSLAYMLARDIWFPTIMHFAWNFTQGIVLDIPISGIDSPGVVGVTRNDDVADWITGGQFGLEGSAVTSVVQLLLTFGLLLMVRAAWPKSSAPEQETPLEAEVLESG